MSPALSDSEIRDALAPFGVRSGQVPLDQIRAYISLLLLWNRTVPLTSVVEPVEIVKRHFGESMFAVSALGVVDGRLADVGSGAGFPGIPLRMISPGLDVTLIEANAKKYAFLSEVMRTLGLDRLSIHRGRMEDFAPVKPFKIIAARAVGNYNGLLSWAGENLIPSGRVVLWLGENDSEMICAKRGWKWRTPLRIPLSRHRYLLGGSPV
jgi:16S rRNA (guanine527-N7)-methyltransferase